MGKIKSWLQLMREDAIALSREDWVHLYGLTNIHVYVEINGEDDENAMGPVEKSDIIQ
jgi:hypothetical protein